MSMRVVVQDASEEEMRAKASDVDVAIAIGVEEDEVAMKIRRGRRRRRRCLTRVAEPGDGGSNLFPADETVGGIARETHAVESSGEGCSVDGSGEGFVSRKNHLDALLLILLLVDASGARARCGHQSRHHARQRLVHRE